MQKLITNRRRLTAMALAFALTLSAGLANAAPSFAQTFGGVSKKVTEKIDSPPGKQCYRAYFVGGDDQMTGRSYRYCKDLKSPNIPRRR